LLCAERKMQFALRAAEIFALVTFESKKANPKNESAFVKRSGAGGN